MRKRAKAGRRVTAGGGHQRPLPGSHPRTTRAPARRGSQGSTGERRPCLPETARPALRASARGASPASRAAPPSLSLEGKGWSGLPHVPSSDRSLKSAPGHPACGSASPAPRCHLLRTGQQAPERPQPRGAAQPPTVTSGASGSQRCWAALGHDREHAQSAHFAQRARAHTCSAPTLRAAAGFRHARHGGGPGRLWPRLSVTRRESPDQAAG